MLFSVLKSRNTCGKLLYPACTYLVTMGTKAYTNTQTDQLDTYTHYTVWPAKSNIKSDWVNPHIWIRWIIFLWVNIDPGL